LPRLRPTARAGGPQTAKGLIPLRTREYCSRQRRVQET
jgi:hypothetical protein